MYRYCTPWYVWNDSVKEKIVAKSPMDAIAFALARKFNVTDQTEIPDSKISWPYFCVDEHGFRSPLPSLSLIAGDSDNAIDEINVPEFTIDKLMALDYFDHLNNQYDPFCEREDLPPE